MLLKWHWQSGRFLLLYARKERSILRESHSSFGLDHGLYLVTDRTENVLSPRLTFTISERLLPLFVLETPKQEQNE